MSGKTYSCYSWDLKCTYKTHEPATKCPQCGGTMRNSTQIRTLGIILILIGLFLSGLMGIITYKFAPALLKAGELKGSGNHSNVVIPAWQLIALFGSVFIFGINSFFTGIWQTVTGYRNKWLFLAFIILIVVMALLVLPIMDSIWDNRIQHALGL